MGPRLGRGLVPLGVESLVEEQCGVGKLFFITLLNVSHAWPKAIFSIWLALETDTVCET